VSGHPAKHAGCAGTEYYTTFAAVFDNKQTPWESSEMPGVNIKDVSDEPLDEQESSQQLHDIGLLIQVDVVAQGTDVATKRNMKTDILKSINTDVTWSGYAFYTEYMHSEFDAQDQQGNKISDVTILFLVKYRKNAWGNNG